MAYATKEKYREYMKRWRKKNQRKYRAYMKLAMRLRRNGANIALKPWGKSKQRQVVTILGVRVRLSQRMEVGADDGNRP